MDSRRSPQIIDDRYKIEAVIHRSRVATIYASRHRNGVPAWIKAPVSLDGASAIQLESDVGNALGSALSVRDDGSMEDGLPYLVLDALEGKLLSQWRANGPLSRQFVLVVGDLLLGALSALHEEGYALGALSDESIWVGPRGIALLDWSEVTHLSDARRWKDIEIVSRLLLDLLAEVPADDRARRMAVAFDAARMGTFTPMSQLRSVWCAFAPDPTPSTDARSYSVLATGEPTSDTPVGATFDAANEVSRAFAAMKVARRGSFPPATALSLSVRSEPSRRARRWGSLVGGGALVAVALASFVAFQGMDERRPTQTAQVPAATFVSERAAPSAEGAMSSLPTTLELTDDGRDLGSLQEEHVAARAAQEAALDLGDVDDDTGLRDLGDVDVGEGTRTRGETANLAGTGSVGVLRVEGGPTGRRIYVDGKVVAQTPSEIEIECGEHRVRIGRRSPSIVASVPCGGVHELRYTQAERRWVPASL